MRTKLLTAVLCAALLGTSTASAGAPTRKSMDLIISEAHAAMCGHDYSRARATIRVRERRNGTTRVVIRVRNAAPNRLHTVWLKLDGASPITGAGATPAAGACDLEDIIDNADTQSAVGANAFYTNDRGHAVVRITLDFRLSEGVFPFSLHDDSLGDVAIGNAPFTFRVISRCADDLQHGLVPGPHEPTFQVSL